MNHLQRQYQSLGAKAKELREWELAQRSGGSAPLPTAPAPAKPAPTAETPTLEPVKPAEQRPLTLDAVLVAVNEDVDNLPHLILYGDSGSGKTFLAQLIAGSRPGQLVILDPKRPQGWKGPKWGGLPYVCRAKGLPEGLDLREFLARSYAPLVSALHSVVAEMVDRYDRQEAQREPFEQLTVVLDEARNSVSESPELAELYKKIISIGREVNVRLILLSTTDRVGPLGFAGEGDAMDSLGEVRLGLFAVNVKRELATTADEGTKYLRAVFYRGGRWAVFDNSETAARLKSLRLGADRVWPGVAYNCQLPVDNTTLLAGLLSGSVKSYETEVPFRFEAASTGAKSAFQSLLPVPSAEGNSIEVLRQEALRAAELLKTIPVTERSKFQKCLQLMNDGSSKTRAIQTEFGIKGGLRFVQVSRWLDAYQLLQEVAQ